MPIPLSPNETWEFVLPGDRVLDDDGTPLDPQPPEAPRFLIRCLSGREQIEWARLVDAWSAAAARLADTEGEGGTTVDYIEAVFAAAEWPLAGWRNLCDRSGQEIPFAPGRLLDVVNSGEARDLLQAELAGPITPEDLGNSDSQSSTPSDTSAPAGAEGV